MPAITAAAATMNAVATLSSSAPDKNSATAQGEDRPFAQVFAEQTGKAAKAENKDSRASANDAKKNATTDTAAAKPDETVQEATDAAAVAAQSLPAQTSPTTTALTSDAVDSTLEEKIQLVAAMLQAAQPAGQAVQSKATEMAAGIDAGKFAAPNAMMGQDKPGLTQGKGENVAQEEKAEFAAQEADPRRLQPAAKGRVATPAAKVAVESPVALQRADAKESNQHVELSAAKFDVAVGSTQTPSIAAAIHAPVLAAAVHGGEYRIATPVGSQPWQTAVGNSLVVMTGAGQDKAELVLTPPQLGRIEVSISMKGDEATAMFVSANPAVREALENALPRLREVLADAGITLGQAQVGAESHGQSAAERQTGDNRSLGAQEGNPNGSSDQSDRSATQAPARVVARTLVDTYV